MLSASNLEAQWPATASPFIPADHWSYAVLRRLDAAGLLPRGADVARRSMPQEEIAGLLRHASEQDASSVLAAYLTRFREELAAPQARVISWLDRSAHAGYDVSTDRVRAGIGYDTVWTGARRIDDISEMDAGVRLAVSARQLAAAVATDRNGIGELQLVLAASALGVWVGRKDLGFATGSGGGLVLDQHRFDGGGVFLSRPLALPVVGATRFEMHFSKVDNVLNLNDEENKIRPWFWTARASFQPHDRFRVAANRAMMFGGAGNLPVTASRFLKNIVGIYTSNDENSFANQVASIDLRYRPPTGSVPTVMYLDFAADDGYGAVWHVPGFTAGVQAGGLPRHDLSLGIERTEFGRNRSSRSLWYQNAWFRGSWADDGIVLGHALGGHGVEWRASAAAGSAPKGNTATLTAYARVRRSQNLFAPQRQGASTGARVSADARITEATTAALQAELEHGTGAVSWNSATARATVQIRF